MLLPKQACTMLLITILLGGLTIVNTLPFGAAQPSTPINIPITLDIRKPSVPEFSVVLVSHPYEVPPFNTTHPYTGVVTAYPGYLEENRSIEITIKNQHFTPYQMADGNWSRLYYNLRFKGHFYIGDWSYYPVKAGKAGEGGYITSSNSDYTTIELPKYLSLEGQPDGSKIDFQVQALIGYDEAIYRIAGNTGKLALFGIFFTGEAGDWSNTQTLIIPDYSEPTINSPPESSSNQTTEPIPSQSPSQNPKDAVLFGLSWGVTTIIALLSIIAVLLIVVVVALHERTKRKTP